MIEYNNEYVDSHYVMSITKYKRTKALSIIKRCNDYIESLGYIRPQNGRTSKYHLLCFLGLLKHVPSTFEKDLKELEENIANERI